MSNESVEIVVCLGSSCFARGNSENLAILDEYAQQHKSSVTLRTTGRLCQEQCKQGPNLMLDGTFHHGVTAQQLRELLQQLEHKLRASSGENHGSR
jgi:NADH:ubiquinone oxidoreductase subunit E